MTSLATMLIGCSLTPKPETSVKHSVRVYVQDGVATPGWFLAENSSHRRLVEREDLRIRNFTSYGFIKGFRNRREFVHRFQLRGSPDGKSHLLRGEDLILEEIDRIVFHVPF